MTKVNWLVLKQLITLTLLLIYLKSWFLPAKAHALNVVSQVSINESLAEVNSIPSNVLVFPHIPIISDIMIPLANRGMGQCKVTAFLLKWLFPQRARHDSTPAESTRSEAGRRGQCSNLNPPLIALVPSKESERESESALGFTAEEFPTFWFYVPSLPSGVNSAEFMLQEFLLQEKKYKDVLESPFTFQVKEGISNFNLQSVGVPLEPDKVYHWYFSIICDSQRPSRNPSIDAWVRLVKPSSELSQIKADGDYKRRLQLYMQEGIWYDTLTLLARLRCQDQDAEFFEAWSSLLQSIGIEEEIAREPILSCP